MEHLSEDLVASVVGWLAASDVLELGCDKGFRLICSSDRVWRPRCLARWCVDEVEEAGMMHLYRVATPLPRSLTAQPNVSSQRLNGELTVRFIGDLGVGDRSVRTREPLGKAAAQPDKKPNWVVMMMLSMNGRAFVKGDQKRRFREVAKRVSARLMDTGCMSLPPQDQQTVFSMPWRSQGKTIVAPRLVSYFEVRLTGSSRLLPSIAPCVAVGVSTAAFKADSLMPGWDAHSWGYHSDDGGVFHSEGGNAARHFGAPFSVGDTVGCGFDHDLRRLFFTRNGVMVPHSFLIKKQDEPLYPTVGIDDSSLVVLNFGDKPFRFNLAGLLDSPNHRRRCKTALSRAHIESSRAPS